MGKIHNMCLPLLTLVVCPEGFQGLNDVLDGGIRTLRATNGLQAIKGLDPGPHRRLGGVQPGDYYWRGRPICIPHCRYG